MDPTQPGDAGLPTADRASLKDKKDAAMLAVLASFVRMRCVALDSKEERATQPVSTPKPPNQLNNLISLHCKSATWRAPTPTEDLRLPSDSVVSHLFPTLVPSWLTLACGSTQCTQRGSIGTFAEQGTGYVLF
ncbi:hypothetical protein THAOC_35824 [Thalassiosira oceanica]|uniref:Uncharacterized protein n=1 Tax=Thalassiosira oceanica TaxID=159749 RepID=K0R2T2_THAOC|nr:hypothetical protein THAOC_35824 [Thalassiosira oceanica]|eukprot:EJK45554.1 hypothetical protein THAOC_35824 [Thalassiosira oceanica]